MLLLITSFLADESGATAIEYSLIAALVSVVGIGALAAFGNSLITIFGKVETTLNSAVAS